MCKSPLMAEIRLPLSIIYETQGVTPVADVIFALQATDAITRDAVSLLPSLIDGLKIEKSSLNVRALTQESPLRELFFISLFVTYQDELVSEVPPMLEDLFNIAVPDKYDTIVTVAFLAVAFYGAGIAIDAVKKAFTDSLPRQKYEELIAVLASETGKPASDIRAILDAKFGQPAAVKRVVKAAKNLFRPSQTDKNAAVLFDRDRVPPDLIRQIPYPGDSDKPVDFDRYKPFEKIKLDIHAMDRDRGATGWAAVADELSDKRLKVKVMEPLTPSALWGREAVVADGVLVSKLTSDGFVPSEIQITSVHDED